jgi:hypothetical protein
MTGALFWSLTAFAGGIGGFLDRIPVVNPNGLVYNI